MSEPDRHASEIDARLAELAGVAGRAAAPPPAAAIRRRARRRAVRNASAATASLALLLVAGAVGADRLRPPPGPDLPAITPTTATRTAAPSRPTPGSDSPTPSRSRAGTSPATPSGTHHQVPSCRTAALAVSTGGTDAGSGHRSLVLLFTNTGRQQCRLTGYPTVTALHRDGGGTTPARHTPSGYLGGLAAGRKPPVVTLNPAQTASAMVEALAFDPDTGNACTPFVTLLVAAPGDTATTRLAWTTDGCGTLEIHPVVPGTGGLAH
jgi:hypothetical protein